MGCSYYFHYQSICCDWEDFLSINYLTNCCSFWANCLWNCESPIMACRAVRTWVVTYIKLSLSSWECAPGPGEGVGHCLDCGLMSMGPETEGFQNNSCLAIFRGWQQLLRANQMVQCSSSILCFTQYLRVFNSKVIIFVVKSKCIYTVFVFFQ